MKAALTIGQAVRRARADLESAGVLCPGASWWYIDDGQLVVRPTKVDSVLRALDRRLEEAGASRGSKALGHKVKSSVKATSRMARRKRAVAGARTSSLTRAR